MTFRQLTALCALAGMLVSSEGLARPTDAELQAASAAEVRGAQLYAYDQAAWHATDSFRADLEKQAIGSDTLGAIGLVGYVSEPAANDELLTTFYGRRSGANFAYARYWTAGGKTLRGGILSLNDDTALSKQALGLISARDRAMAVAAADKAALCSKGPPNILMLPADPAGGVSVYILTPSTQTGVYPGGGHYRYDFDGNGTLVSKRQFMKTCFNFDTRDKGGKKPEVVFITHLLDAQPTEVHVFTSYYAPVTFAVVTVSNKEIWEVASGKIQFASDVGK